MAVTLSEMKTYLRVDYDEDDALIESLISSAEKLCMDILRTEDSAALDDTMCGRIAVLYTVAYLYEHREDADHHRLTMTLRSLLFGDRKAAF